MEINITIKNVQKPEDILSAFAGLGSGAQNTRPPLRRGRREASATNASNRRSPSLILTQRELAALQQSHPQGAQNLLSSTDAEANFSGNASGSGARAKMRAQPFSAFQRPQRQHAGRTLSPGPYYRRGDQLEAGDASIVPKPTMTKALMDEAMSPPTRPLLVRRRQPQTSPRRSPRRSPYRQSSRARSPRARSSRAQSSRAQSSRAQSSRAQSPRASRTTLQLTPRPGASSRRRSSTPRRMDSRSRTPPATAPKAKPRTRSASSSSSTLLRPAATGADRYKTPAMPSTFKFPKNTTRYTMT